MDNNPLKNLFAIPDLRNRVLFTLALLGVYRIGNHIPTPGVNQEALLLLADQARNTMFGLYDMFSGGNLSRVTIFALGIMPYISSSIILQLLTVVWPYLERLSKEGELGRRKITQYTRYLTLLLAAVASVSLLVGAALPLGLVAVGVALRPRALLRFDRGVLATNTIKLVLMPVLVLVLACAAAGRATAAAMARVAPMDSPTKLTVL